LIRVLDHTSCTRVSDNKRWEIYVGEKKRERKEMIAAKRRERAIARGLDLQAINKVLILTS
jgi:hypothetical protein